MQNYYFINYVNSLQSGLVKKEKYFARFILLELYQWDGRHGQNFIVNWIVINIQMLVLTNDCVWIRLIDWVGTSIQG